MKAIYALVPWIIVGLIGCGSSNNGSQSPNLPPVRNVPPVIDEGDFIELDISRNSTPLALSGTMKTLEILRTPVSRPARLNRLKTSIQLICMQISCDNGGRQLTEREQCDANQAGTSRTVARFVP